MLARTRWAAILLTWLPLAVAAQAPYPNKPIKWIVPYTPGGITDSVTRIITQKLAENLGQPIVIENKPGANSIVGAEYVAKSAPDGYTILTVIGGHAANATLYAGRLSFDPVKSFSPISLAGIAPLIMTANNDFPPKDVKELIAYAKANPGKISFGSSGVGSATHLTFELLKQTAGIDMVHIPFKGTAPALAAEMGGDIQVLGDVPSSLMPQVRAGKIKALGLFASKRSSGAPEVPTIVKRAGRRWKVRPTCCSSRPPARRSRSSTASRPRSRRSCRRRSSSSASSSWASIPSAIRRRRPAGSSRTKWPSGPR